MATTLAKLKYDIANIIRGGIRTDEDPVSLSQIGFWITNTRAELLRQQINKGRSLSDNYVQKIGCADMELADLSACCNINTECKGYRTVLRLPQPIEAGYSDLITRVGPVNFTDPAYHFMDVHRVSWELLNKWTTNIPKAFLYDGRVYVVGQNLLGLRKINIEGVFEDPSDIARFKNCEGDPCFSDGSPYPISNWMIETMKTMIKDRDLQLILATNLPDPNDATLDANIGLKSKSDGNN